MVFLRSHHVRYFQRCLKVLPCAFATLDDVRMTIAYFAVSGLDLLNAFDEIEDPNTIIEWIYSLQVLPDSKGTNVHRCGFRGSQANGCCNGDGDSAGTSHEFDSGHIAMTYTALLTLVILGDDLSRVDKFALLRALKALQKKTGSFSASVNGSEDDMRFVYCASAICYMLHDWSGMDADDTLQFIRNCYCYDGGIAPYPGLESHGGSTFCAVASLSLMGKLESTLSERQLNRLSRWCLFRQQSGFQGRPNKPIDTCYSFWVGAALELLGAFKFVESGRNLEFLDSTQDQFVGGFSKWPDSDPDPMHTYMGIAGMSLMGVEDLLPLHPALNLSQRAHGHLQQLHKAWDSHAAATGNEGEERTLHRENDVDRRSKLTSHCAYS
ncbi:geranylgeranyl transferase type-1 subunit beta [Ixodes scapularis]